MKFQDLQDSAQYLGLEGFYEQFDSFERKTKYQIFKLERLQSYQEPDNESYVEYFQNNNRASAKQILRKNLLPYAESYKEMCRRNIAFIRVRAVELPLSEYLQWEFLSYQESAKYGERILIADITHEPSKSDLKESSDFLLFDDFAALIHDYNNEGVLQGAWVVEEILHLQKLQWLRENFIQHTVPLGYFEKVQKDVFASPSNQNL